MSQVSPAKAASRTRAAGSLANPGEDGSAAIDALVALSILTGTIVLALNATDAGRRAASSALETREASALLSNLAESTPVEIGTYAGRSGRLLWRVDNTLETVLAQSRDARICRRKVSVSGQSRSRAYELTTLKPCPARTAR